MNQERVYTVLLGAHVSEKTSLLSDAGDQLAFKVDVRASKLEIKTAVEKLFKVEVNGVRTVNVKGKRKTFSRRAGKRKDWKKAYIRLAEGQEIDMTAD